MTGTTHQMAALVTALFFLTIYPVSLGLTLGILAVISVMIGALTPDLDQPTANIWRRMIGGNTVGNVFKAFSGGHRHLTHSIIGIIIVGWGLSWFINHIISPNYTGHASVLWIAFMIGYVSHPVLDTLTDNGVPWFWPLKFNLKLPPGPEELRVTTNSFVERIVVRSGIVVVAVLLLETNWEILINFFR